jgi:hypothetical protein
MTQSLRFLPTRVGNRMSAPDTAMIRSAVLAVEQTGDGVFRDADWLEESRGNKEEFFDLLLAHQSSQSAQPFKSIPSIGIDLYHDLIIRHLQEAGERPALVYRSFGRAAQQIRSVASGFNERADGWEVLTYAALHAACTERCTQWEAKGVKTGDGLCVVSALDRELLIALLSGLRMGLTVTVLPPSGPDFLKRRIDAIPKAHISCNQRYASLLRPFISRCMFVEDLPPPAIAFTSATSSLTCAAEHPALALFSPHSHIDLELQPTVVQASAVLEGALRDGLFHFSLRPGTVLAAPDSNFSQYQPGLLLTCLLHAATYLHISAGDLLADQSDDKWPMPLNVLLLSGRVHDSLLNRSAKPRLGITKGLRLWLREALSPASAAWDDVVERFALRSVAAGSLWYDTAAGGCLLFSMRSLGHPPRYLRAAPGVPFQLRQPTNQRDTTRGGLGLWEPVKSGAGLLLMASNGGFLYTGTFRPSQHGRCYPILEVESTLSELPFVVGISAVCEPNDGGFVSLLIFTGPEPLEQSRELAAARESMLRERISARLDQSCQPSSIELFAIYPRLLDGQIDHQWCAHEFRQGTLRKREEEPIFQLLDGLRAGCAASRGEAKDAQPSQAESRS